MSPAPRAATVHSRHSVNHRALVLTRPNTQTPCSLLQYGDASTTRTRMQYQVGQLLKAVACVGYEYQDPHSQTDPLIPDSWRCSCSLFGFHPRCKEQWSLGTAPTPPHMKPQAPGVRKRQRGTYACPQCNCQVVAGGHPPRGRHKPN